LTQKEKEKIWKDAMKHKDTIEKLIVEPVIKLNKKVNNIIL